MRTLKAFVRLGLLTFVCTVSIVSNAAASGSFNCEVEDKSLKFSAESMFSHGLGEQFLGFKGTLGALMKDAPKDFASIELDGTHLVHHWFHEKALKLHVYRERPGEGLHGYVELILETKQNPKDETDFAGTYELTVFDMPSEGSAEGRTLRAKGKISCSVG
jgi:hypothetical protein